jgi:hypothetical protein
LEGNKISSIYVIISEGVAGTAGIGQAGFNTTQGGVGEGVGVGEGIPSIPVGKEVRGKAPGMTNIGPDKRTTSVTAGNTSVENVEKKAPASVENVEKKAKKKRTN